MEQIATRGLTISKENSLLTLMKDEKFQDIFKQAIADNINRLELGSVYAAVPGEGRFEKAQNLLEDFTERCRRLESINSNLRQLDIGIAEAQGILSELQAIYQGIEARNRGESAFNNYLVGTDFKNLLRDSLIPKQSSSIELLEQRKASILEEKAQLV